MRNEFKDYKEFWIGVGDPGAYKKNMYISDDNIIDLYGTFGIMVKHAPFSAMSKLKNVVVQSWKDEDGDDVWLPLVTDSQTGQYKPAVTHEAVDYNPTLLIYFTGEEEARDNANQMIRSLINRIEGRWLKLWDDYTQIGFDGAYLIDVDDDPKFIRRSDYVLVEFGLKFKINGTNVDAPFFNRSIIA